jgi:hypothetical protein
MARRAPSVVATVLPGCRRFPSRSQTVPCTQNAAMPRGSGSTQPGLLLNLRATVRDVAAQAFQPRPDCAGVVQGRRRNALEGIEDCRSRGSRVIRRGNRHAAVAYARQASAFVPHSDPRTRRLAALPRADRPSLPSASCQNFPTASRLANNSPAMKRLAPAASLRACAKYGEKRNGQYVGPIPPPCGVMTVGIISPTL